MGPPGADGSHQKRPPLPGPEAPAPLDDPETADQVVMDRLRGFIAAGVGQAAPGLGRGGPARASAAHAGAAAPASPLGALPEAARHRQPREPCEPEPPGPAGRRAAAPPQARQGE
ncbi:unnamed protein product, partial [Prorocentrum cordatum]